MKRPMTRSCIVVVLEKHIVRRTSRLIRVRRLRCLLSRSYWIPGSYAPTWSEKRTCLFKTIEKEGLQGGQGDNNWVVRHRHIHDPGIQQEPPLILRWCPSIAWMKGRRRDVDRSKVEPDVQVGLPWPTQS